MDLEGGSGEFHVAMPYSMLEPIRDLLVSGFQNSEDEKDERWQIALQRDILMAKARAYKEQTAHQNRQPTPEQLSMEVENEAAATEESVDMPLNQNDLEVPTYLRRQQSQQDEMDG